MLYVTDSFGPSCRPNGGSSLTVIIPSNSRNWESPVKQQPVHVQIAHGGDDFEFLRERLCPSLLDSTERPIIMWTMGYDGTRFSVPDALEIDVRASESAVVGDLGFGACHNRLFEARGTEEDFILLNPDCVLVSGSIDRLLDRKSQRRRAAIVEGRQWPYEHPKEFDRNTGATPWASGAFCLVSGDFFSRCGGFDESFFLYLEDVDLSWRAWLAGFEVVYEPTALVRHFSGGPFHRQDLRSAEEYFSSRNFLMLARKYFGIEGEQVAIRMVESFFNESVSRRIIDDFATHYRDKITPADSPARHPMIKILGFNQFHEMRS